MVPSFEKRIRAFAIDTSGAIIVTLIASFGVAPFNQILAQVISLVGLFLFYLFPYFKNTGQTLGKRVQKIKVVMKNNMPAPIWLLIVRDFTKISLSIITSGLYMIFATIIMDSHVSRTFHDYLFQTKVIDLEMVKNTENILGKSSLLKKKGL